MLHPESTTFAQLWEKLSLYSAFYLFDELTGEQYNAIVEPCNQANDEDTFSFSNVNDTEEDFRLSADTKIVDLYETDDSLVFAIHDEYDTKHEFFLQARIKPVLS